MSQITRRSGSVGEAGIRFYLPRCPEAPCNGVSRKCYCLSGTQDDVPDTSRESYCRSQGHPPVSTLDCMESVVEMGKAAEKGKCDYSERRENIDVIAGTHRGSGNKASSLSQLPLQLPWLHLSVTQFPWGDAERSPSCGPWEGSVHHGKCERVRSFLLYSRPCLISTGPAPPPPQPSKAKRSKWGSLFSTDHQDSCLKLPLYR